MSKLQVKSANANRKLLSSTQEKENSLAIMLILIVIVFLVCNVISLINLFARLLSGRKRILFLDSLRNFALVFNSSINFIIYCTYGEKFRSTIYEILPARLKTLYRRRQSSILNSAGGGRGGRGTTPSSSTATATNASVKGHSNSMRVNGGSLVQSREYRFSCSSSRDSNKSRM